MALREASYYVGNIAAMRLPYWEEDQTTECENIIWDDLEAT